VDGKTFARFAKVAVPKILHEENAHHFATQEVLSTKNSFLRAKSLM
jgi:hypothetical protein